MYSTCLQSLEQVPLQQTSVAWQFVSLMQDLPMQVKPSLHLPLQQDWPLEQSELKLQRCPKQLFPSMHFELQHAWLAEQSESKVHLWPKQLLLRKHFEWQHAWLAEQSESILLPNTHLFPQHINLSIWLAQSLSVRQKWLKQLSRRSTPSNQDPVPQQTLSTWGRTPHLKGVGMLVGNLN